MVTHSHYFYNSINRKFFAFVLNDYFVNRSLWVNSNQIKNILKFFVMLAMPVA